MSNLPLVRERALDANGEPVSGAKLYTYAAGTTTPKATYAEAALVNAHNNPVVADSGGFFSQIYLDSTAYKLKLTDADEVTIWESDNVYAAQLEGDSTAARLAQVAANPLDQGAVGNGVADESADVQAAINAATGVVDLLGKTYRCDSMLTLRSGITLRNGTLNFASCSATEYVRVLGSVGSPVAASAAFGVTSGATVSASTSGLVAGDLLHLACATGWESGNNTGELGRVGRVIGASVLLLGYKPEAEYALAASPTIAKITPVTDVRLENLTIIGATSGSSDALAIAYADRIDVVGCEFRNVAGSAVQVHASANVRVERCAVRNTTAYGGYGVDIGTACRDVWVADCTIERVGTAIRLGYRQASFVTGQTRNVIIRGCSAIGCTIGVYVTASAELLQIIDNAVTAIAESVPTFGIICCGSRNVIRGNKVSGCSDAAIVLTPNETEVLPNEAWFAIEDNCIDKCTCAEGIRVGGSGYSTLRRGNVARNSIASGVTSGVVLALSNCNASQLTVSDNRIYGVTKYGVSVAATRSLLATAVDSVSVINNQITTETDGTGTDYAGVSCSASGGATLARVLVSGNTINAGDAFGVEASAVSGIAVVGNTIYGNGTYGERGVSVATCSNVRVAQNGIQLFTTGVSVEPDGGSCLVVAENAMSLVTNGIVIDGTNASAADDYYGVVISNNAIQATQRGVLFEGRAFGMTVAGNAVRLDGDTYNNIQLGDGFGSTTVEGVAITGNALVNGASGLNLDAVGIGNGIQDGNCYYSMSGASHSAGVLTDGDHAT